MTSQVSKIGFVGAGQMAKAFGLSLVRNGQVKPSNLSVSCPEEHLLLDWKTAGCSTSLENDEILEKSDTLFWAVKPQIFSNAVSSSKCSNRKSQFHISLMAGIPLSTFSDKLSTQFSKTEISTARVMPNVAMKVGSGCSVYTMGPSATTESKVLLESLLKTVGLTFEVPESQINAYCGLFSSGTGFMFTVLEALSDGAVKMGIPRDLSMQIAAQTMKGAAELLLNDPNSHPGILKDSVCSPGGTTIAGIATLEKYGVRNALIEAIEVATLRGEQLGKKA